MMTLLGRMTDNWEEIELMYSNQNLVEMEVSQGCFRHFACELSLWRVWVIMPGLNCPILDKLQVLTPSSKFWLKFYIVKS